MSRHGQYHDMDYADGERHDGVVKDVRSRLESHGIAVRVLIALAMMAFMLYPISCKLYGAWRRSYESEYVIAASSERNEQLRNDISSLMSQETIEDMARRYGYVKPGETLVVVPQLYSSPTSVFDVSHDAGVEFDAPWWLRIIDTVFRFEHQ